LRAVIHRGKLGSDIVQWYNNTIMKLTSKQKNILGYIREYIENRNENPTPYKLHKYLAVQGIKESLKGLMQVIEALEKKDLIKRDDKKIYLVKDDSFANLRNIISIPLYGLASCGEALAHAEDEAFDYLQLSRNLFKREPRNLFAVKALGNSMNKDGINDGDYVIFQKYEAGESLDGKIVVAVINGMATIKRYHRVDSNIIGLFPSSTNCAHHPIFIHCSDSILIAGIFEKVLPVKFVSL
jgi:SOS-response transcriptional repressor LexA